MSLRLRLILAFFVLSVVPLTAVTFYAYQSNVAALRAAAQGEADLLAGELSQRMQLVTSQLAERVEHLVNLTELQSLIEQSQTEQTATLAAAPVAQISQQIANSIGEAAALLNNVELRGLRTGRAGGRRGAPTGGNPGRRGGPPPDQTGQPPRTIVQVGEGGEGPIQIDLAAIRRSLFREIMPEGQNRNLTPEERERVGQEINARMLGIQEGLRLSVQALQQQAEAAEEAAASLPPPAPPPVTAAAVTTTELSGRQLGVTLKRGGEIVQQVSAEVNFDNVLATVFQTTQRSRGEVPFAVDAEGHLYTQSDDDTAVIESLGQIATGTGPATVRLDRWIVVTTADPSGSGVRLGIARPIGDSLASLRVTAARNAGLGLLFIGLALIGIVPLSGRLTRNLSVLSDGVRRIADGDYRARVPVTSGDEIGRLASAFNQMAEDVEVHQRSAVDQARLRRELELGRRIQDDMLPRTPLQIGLTEIKGVSVPAREVGGDFFNYFALPNGTIALLVGDVSGKGVGAALLMANIQASLRIRLSMGQQLTAVAEELDREVAAGSPGPVYATLFLGIIESDSRQLRYVNAGHNPQYVLRADRSLERMAATGMPVGLLAGHGYTEQTVQLAAGDVLFFFTDGCVEAESPTDQMFGVDRLEAVLASSSSAPVDEVLANVERAVAEFRQGRELFDDATMMVARIA